MSDVHQHRHNQLNPVDETASIRLAGSILLNFIITVAEIIGGVLSGSLSLLSDALHNFSDTASLAVSFIAIRISDRQPDRRNTFGYRRAQIIGALINLLTLVIIALFLIREAVERYLNPQPIQGPVMLAVASIGLMANLLTALLLYRQSKNSLNIRSAFIHIIGDLVSSVGVVIGAILIIQYQIYFIDALLTAFISLYILFHSMRLLRQTINILMQAVPEGLDINQIIVEVKSIPTICDVHHLHVWQLDENHASLEAHIVIQEGDVDQMTALRHAVKEKLADRFHINHSTLEFEFQKCESPVHSSCYEVIRK